MEETKTCSCPIETGLKYIGNKWSINLIRDMFMGKKRFSEFIISNKGLSTKVLSQRLKDLEKNKVIEKRITTTSPITIEYILTPKGRQLNKLIYELANFSINQYCKEDKEKILNEIKVQLAIN